MTALSLQMIFISVVPKLIRSRESLIARFIITITFKEILLLSCSDFYAPLDNLVLIEPVMFMTRLMKEC